MRLNEKSAQNKQREMKARNRRTEKNGKKSGGRTRSIITTPQLPMPAMRYDRGKRKSKNKKR